ncbi:MAG: HAD family hydrolase [Promethearchaeota archaeon]
MTIKAIIFDLGGVIIELDFSNFFNKIISESPLNNPKTPILLEFFRQSDLYHQGKMTDKEFYQLACDLLQVCILDQSDFFNAFNSIISGFNSEMIELIKKIRNMNKFKLIALSNINSSHWNYLLSQKWNFIEYFDEMILSHKVKMLKPNPNLFKYAIEKAGCKPEEIVFVDDGFNNVRSAIELGIIGIQFSGVKQLINHFKSLKIL